MPPPFSGLRMSEIYNGRPPFQKHSDTSEAASAAIEPNAGTLRKLVLDHIRAQREGATDEEIATALGLDGNTERPRRRELQLAGLIHDSGRRRKTTTGRLATVWL